jgi:prevent-host-death family protein
MSWQLQQAKARLSEVIRRAGQEGPQVITQHGKDAAVLLSIEDYRRLAKVPSFVDFLLGEPKFDDEAVALINDRSRHTGRVIDL